MAITSRGAGAAVYSSQNGTSVAPAANGTTVPGDRLVLIVMTKPDTGTVADVSGWERVGEIAGGTGTTGIDTGPTRLTIFSRIAAGSGAANNPGTVTLSGSNISAAQVLAYAHGAGNTSEIVFTGAADTTTGTPHSVTMPVNPGLTAGDFLVAAGVIPTDVSTPAQFSAETVSATGMTTVTLTEVGEIDTATGQDLGGWIANGPVVTGTATAAPTVSATAGGTTTNVAGPIGLVRMREIPQTATQSASDSGTLSVTEVASVTVIATVSVSDSGTFSASESASAAPFTPPPEVQIVSDTAVTSSATSFNVASTTDAVQVDDLLLYIVAGNATLEDYDLTSITGVSNTGVTTLVQNDGTLVRYAKATSAGTATLAVAATGSANTRARLFVIRNYGWEWPLNVKGNTAYVNDFARVFETVQYNDAVDIVFSKNDQFEGPVESSVGTLTAVSDNTLTGGTRVSSAYVTGRPAAGTSYYFGNPGSSLTNTQTFSIELRTPGDVFYTPIANPQLAGTALTNLMYKDVTVAVGAGDLVVATGMTANANGAGTGTLATQSGSTGTWNVGRSSNTTNECGFVIGHAEVTSGTSLTVRVTAPSSGASTQMGGGVWVIKAGKWSGTPTYTSFGPSDADGKASVVVADTSIVLYSGADWSAGSVSTSTAPLNGDIGTVYSGGTDYGLQTVSWVDQAAGTRNYGPANPFGDDWVGAVVQIAQSSAPASEPISGSDSGTFSVTETADVVVTSDSKAVSDSGTLSVTETASIGVVLAVSDTATLSVIEQSGNSSALSRTDTGTLSVTDSSANSSTLSRTDTGTLSVTESVGLVSVLAVTDGGTLSATDTSNVTVTFSAISVSDTGTLSVTDATTNASTLSRTDTGTISVTESSANALSLSRTDSGSLSVTEAIAQSNTIALTDSGTLSATESIATLAGLSRADSGTISVTDTISGSSTGTAAETGTISVTDSSSVLVSFSVSDSGTLSVTEAPADIQVFGTLSKNVSDSGTLSVTESTSMQQSLAVSVSDSGTFSVSESRQIASTSAVTDTGTLAVVDLSTNALSMSRTDSGTISATDGATVFNDRPGADSGTLSVTETASVVISGLIIKSVSDSGTVSATDSITGRAAFVPVSDAGTISATESSTNLVTVARTDTGTISATDSASLLVIRAVSDSGTISADDSVALAFFTGTQVAVWDGTTMKYGTIRIWDGVAFQTPPVKVWNGTTFVLP